MALEKVRDILKAAQQANTAVIAFDALDCNTISACIRGAERARRPVIVMLYPNMRSMMPFAAFAQAVKSMARSASVPVGPLQRQQCDSGSYSGWIYLCHGGWLCHAVGGEHCVHKIGGGYGPGI